jgi:two-component system CheB/CheR fusion protein
LKRKDGVYRWILDIAKPTYLPDGSFSGFIGSGSEIHDKKLIQEELEQQVNERTADLQRMNVALQRSNNELEQFAYVASHDLQEPLRKILTFADRLTRMQSEFPDTAATFVNKIIESSERMRKLIDELLKFSRTTQSNAKFTTVDLQSLFEALVVDFELIISEKNAVITHDKLPSIEGISVQMEQYCCYRC